MRITPLVLSFALFATLAHAQTDLPSVRTRALLDSALSVLGMRADDMAMPADLLTTVRQRGTMHYVLFEDPLRAIRDQARIAESIASRSHDRTAEAFKAICTRIGAQDDRPLSTQRQITSDDITRRLGVDIVRKASNVQSTMFVQYVGPYMTAHERLIDAVKPLARQRTVVEQCDSLWMMTREDETRDLFTMHANGHESMKTATRFFDLASPTLVEDLHATGLGLYQDLLLVVRAHASNLATLHDSVTSVEYQTPIGRIAIGGKGVDTYRGDYAVIIDVGGDDRYELTVDSKSAAMKTVARVIIDLSGNDVYHGSAYALGAGIGGVSILIDQDGNDVYTGSDFSIASAVFGVGIVHDLAGNDLYNAGQNSIASAMFGVGLLLDDDGHDVYRVHAQGQGFGGTRGFAMISDLAGNDQYLASSPFTDVLRYEEHFTTFSQGAALGFRPLAAGGDGVLDDRRGNDLYVSDIYGQGTGYWFGIGSLYDHAGEDRYQSYQYAQGAGVHFATGALIDRGGNDVYVSHGVSQGCGHDIAFGVLSDESGNDAYVVESLSLGGGNANAVSICIDERGDDSYLARDTTNTLGFSDFRRSYGMIGVFVDGGGSDRYATATGNNSVAVRSTYGVMLDLNTVDSTPPPPPTVAQQRGVLASTPDSLFIQASAAPLRYQGDVQPARDSLIALGPAIFPMVRENIETEMPRERLALEQILVGMHKNHPDSVVRFLKEEMDVAGDAGLALCATIAGRIKSAELLPPFVVLLTDEKWQRRRLAAFTIGEIGDTSAVHSLFPLLSDQHPYVRARAAYAIGKLSNGIRLDALDSSLVDPDAIVRYAAVEGVARGPKRTTDEVTAAWKRLKEPLRIPQLIRLVGCVEKNDEARTSIQSALSALSGADPTWTTQRSGIDQYWLQQAPPAPKKKGKKRR